MEVKDGRYAHGDAPPNVVLDTGTLIRGPRAFARFKSTRTLALVVGKNCTLDGVHFALNPDARLTIGDDCAFSGSLILVEAEITIGNRVVIGWNAVLSDSDFHPIDPDERRLDAIACSTLPEGPRRHYASKPVVIGDDVFVGHNATVLKGVTIGAGAFIEPGAMVTRDIPPGARVLGNPAIVVTEA